jgi:hypothetical protein
MQDKKPSVIEMRKTKNQLKLIRYILTPIVPMEQPTRQIVVKMEQFFHVCLSVQSITVIS